MCKYGALWEWIAQNGTDCFTLRFDEIAKIAGVPIDHSFLKYKRELIDYGYTVEKISMKAQQVSFMKIKEG